MKYQIIILYLFTMTTVDAQIVFDGTLGPVDSLTGPEVMIKAEMGQQMGPNLFHSFEKFNLNLNESATFWGPNTIENVISRVTGGASYIDGKLISKIPNADMYFINPAGIVFGPNASLNIPGSLYISTADYLRLGENGRFDATEPSNSILTIAPPAAFGFLDHKIGPIEIYDSQLKIPSQEVIEQSLKAGEEIKGDTLAFIGGDITINDGILFSLGGKIQLASLASQGEITIDMKISSKENIFTKLGKIMITDSTKGSANQQRYIANIDVSGFGGGEIFIRAGQLILDNGYIFADTFGTKDGQGIKIEVTDDVILKNGAMITSNAVLNATDNAGNISIRANQIHLEEGSQINSSSLNTAEGNAGEITIKTEKLSIKGFNTTILENGESLSSAIFSDTLSESENSRGGDIKITTKELVMDELAEIRSKTIGFGHAGDIFVEADRMALKGGSQIIAGSGDDKHLQGSGLGGSIVIRVNESTLITGQKEVLSDKEIQTRHSGFLSNTFTKGTGGTIELFTPQLTIQNNGTIQTASRGEGDAGNIIFLTINDMALHNNSTITTQAEKATGGNITIQVNNRLDLFNSQISAEAKGEKTRDHGGNLIIEPANLISLYQSQIFTDGYIGNGGNLTIKRANFVTLNQSKIFTGAVIGDGGDIKINAGQFLQSSDSLLDASSTLGVDGKIEIEAPDTNIGEDVVILPKQLVTPKLRNWCETQLRDGKNSSRFSQWVNWIGIPRDELKGVLGSFLDLEE